MSAPLNRQQFSIPASQVQVGDHTDRSGKTRVSKVHQPPSTERVLAQVQTRGARSPSVQSWHKDDVVKVWRKP